MSGFNLPPGVSAYDIPGNRPEDVAYDRALERLIPELHAELAACLKGGAPTCRVNVYGAVETHDREWLVGALAECLPMNQLFAHLATNTPESLSLAHKLVDDQLTRYAELAAAELAWEAEE